MNLEELIAYHLPDKDRYDKIYSTRISLSDLSKILYSNRDYLKTNELEDYYNPSAIKSPLKKYSLEDTLHGVYGEICKPNNALENLIKEKSSIYAKYINSPCNNDKLNDYSIHTRNAKKEYINNMKYVPSQAPILLDSKESIPADFPQSTQGPSIRVDWDELQAAMDEATGLKLRDKERVPVISANRHYTASNGYCRLFITYHKDAEKALRTALLSHAFGSHPATRQLVPKQLNSLPIAHDEYFINLAVAESEGVFDLKHYVNALARIERFGLSIVQGTGIILPIYTAPSFEEVRNTVPHRGLIFALEESYTAAGTALTDPSTPFVVSQPDSKLGNLEFGIVLDIEHFKLMKGPSALCLPMVQNCIPLDRWHEYVSVYLKTLEEKTPSKEYVLETTGFVHAASIVPILKELNGIYSRPMGEKEKLQAGVLEHFAFVTYPTQISRQALTTMQKGFQLGLLAPAFLPQRSCYLPAQLH